MSWCDCEDEGREAYLYDRYSYDTQRRLEDARYGGSECDREFASGYRSQAIREEREREDREAEEAAYNRERAAQQEAEYFAAQQEAEYFAAQQAAYEAEQQAAYAEWCAQQEQPQ